MIKKKNDKRITFSFTITRKIFILSLSILKSVVIIPNKIYQSRAKVFKAREISNFFPPHLAFITRDIHYDYAKS